MTDAQVGLSGQRRHRARNQTGREAGRSTSIAPGDRKAKDAFCSARRKILDCVQQIEVCQSEKGERSAAAPVARTTEGEAVSGFTAACAAGDHD